MNERFVASILACTERMRPMRGNWTAFFCIGMATASMVSFAQQPITLQDAVKQASTQYPSVRVSQEQVDAAAASIRLARTAYLPHVDATAGVNRATHNNIFGLLLPSQVISPISGPVLGTNNLDNVWGSVAGFLVSWEPFDFGERRANIAAAEATKARAQAVISRTQLEVETLTADAFLTLLAAQETARAAQAGVDRAGVLVRTVDALVKSQLRPGSELSRSQAEEAAARTQLIRAQQAVDEARATLAQFLLKEPAQVAVATGILLQLPAEIAPAVNQVSKNPLAVEQNAAVEEAKARLRVLERSYFPRFNLQGAAYARGTGVLPNGAALGGLNGLGPSVQNYAMGFTATFPLFDLPSVRAKEAAQSATVRAESSRYEQVLTELTGRLNIAKAQLDGVRRIAENTPQQVEAARAADRQAAARYQSGLGTIVEVADAQRLLTEAEIDDGLARLAIWRAKLTVAAAEGDLQPFLQEVAK